MNTVKQELTLTKRALKSINPEQFKPEARKGIPMGECKHVTQSRKDPNTDLNGYAVKFKLEAGVVIVNMCEKCAIDAAKLTVARIPYGLLSQTSLVKMIANSSPKEKVVANSERGKYLLKKVEEAKAIFQMIGAQVDALKDKGMAISNIFAVVTTDKGKNKGKFASVKFSDPERVTSLANLLDFPGSRFVCGLARGKKEKNIFGLFLADKASTRTMKDIAALKDHLDKKPTTSAAA